MEGTHHATRAERPSGIHGSISARGTSNGVEIFTFGWDEGPAVERKYGSQIFGLSDPAVAHFNENFLWPWLRNWFETL